MHSVFGNYHYLDLRFQLELNYCHQSQNCRRNSVHLLIQKAEISCVFAPLSARVLYKTNLPHREHFCSEGINSRECSCLMRWSYQFNKR